MGTTALWVGFNACVVAMLALDLALFQHHAHATSLKEAAVWSAVWVSLSLGFNLWILRAYGSTPAVEFLTGYVIEKSLSVDNIFVFLLVFRAFGVLPQFQHRVLFWGVFGALLLRGLMIAASAALVQRFDWILYLFGAILVIAGLRLLIRGRRDFHPEGNPMLRWMRRVFPMPRADAGGRFWVVENGRLAITPLLVTLIVLEGIDVLFAVDSVPAVFGVTRDPFLVYTSNVCAILGLRAMYFLLAGALPYFRFLETGVSGVLIFVGSKMLADPWIHVPTRVSLGIVAAILGTSIAASVATRRSSGISHG
jgi:tellurite resistance protein TerC